jgi:hypothetical protein
MSIEGLDLKNYKSINQSIFKDWALCQLKDKAIEITRKINQSIKNEFAANLDLNGRGGG